MLPAKRPNTTEERDGKLYSVRRINETRVVKYGVEEFTFKAKFNSEIEHDKIAFVKDELHNMFDEILQQATQDHEQGQKLRMTIDHRSLDKPIVIHLQPRENITADTIMSR